MRFFSAGRTSIRTLAAELGDSHHRRPGRTLRELAEELGGRAFQEMTVEREHDVARARELIEEVGAAMRSGKAKTGADSNKLKEELAELTASLEGGCCLAGRTAAVGPCEAYEIGWSPSMLGASIEQVHPRQPSLWGRASAATRLVAGIAPELAERLAALAWPTLSGSKRSSELSRVIDEFRLVSPPNLPIREAIDYTYGLISATILVEKLGRQVPQCGGAVEVAVITNDRPFRWIRHKPLDAALSHGYEVTHVE